MANELQITTGYTYSKNGVGSYQRSQSGNNVSVNGNNFVDGVLSVTTSDTTIPLGPVSGALGWAWFKNLDAVNTINIKVAAAGTIILSLLPGEACCFRFGSGVTAPVAIAVGATSLMEYCILPP